MRLQVPAPALTAFDVCPLNASGHLQFVSVDGQITLLVLFDRKSIERTIYFVHLFTSASHLLLVIYDRQQLALLEVIGGDGKKMHSVFDLPPFLPVCISWPKRAKFL